MSRRKLSSLSSFFQRFANLQTIWWDQSTLLDQMFEHYDRLDADIRAEIPLRRIWTVVPDDTDEHE